MPPQRRASAVALAAVAALFAAMAALTVYGFFTAGLFSQTIWEPAGQERIVQFAGLFFALAAVVMILAPWLFTRLAAAILILVTTALLPKAILAVAFFLLSAWCLGELVSAAGPLLATLLGTAIYVAIMPLIARLPIHYPAFYFVALATPVAIRRPPLRFPAFSPLSTWSERGAFALLALVFTIHWFAMLKPEAGADGLALHLAVPANMAQHHAFTWRPDRFLLSVMPMGADFLNAIVYQFGGEMAARLLNLVLLATLLGLLHAPIRRWVSPAMAWLLLALFAASPVVELATGELFSENLLAALLMASLIAVSRKWFVPAAVLAAAAIATKFGSVPFVACLLIYAAFEVRRTTRRSAAIAAAVLIVAAAPTYVIAWKMTGNPLFPFLNQKFPSRYLPAGASIQDGRFHQPLTLRTPYDLAFRSTLYYEGQNGSFGFQYLIFLPLALAAIFVAPDRLAAGAVWVALGAGILVLRSNPNARYLYPELPLLTLPFAALAGWAAANSRPLYRAIAAFLVLATALNAWFLPSSSYYHKDLYGPFTDAQRAVYMGRNIPIRAVIDWFNRVHPGAAVLLAEDGDLTGLKGEVYENHWHQYNIWERIRTAPDREVLLHMLEKWNVRYVIARKRAAGQPLRPASLRGLLGLCSNQEFAFGGVMVLALQSTCVAVSPVQEGPLMLVEPGAYDDFHAAIRYNGGWERNSSFDEPLSGTVSFTDETGSEASLAFIGTELTWYFAKAVNRGIATVTIDGASKGDFDLYSASTQWRQHLTFQGLAPGTHRLVIRVTGRHRAEASGAYVDVDALEVR